jgi:hypothetical protein
VISALATSGYRAAIRHFFRRGPTSLPKLLRTRALDPRPDARSFLAQGFQSLFLEGARGWGTGRGCRAADELSRRRSSRLRGALRPVRGCSAVLD